MYVNVICNAIKKKVEEEMAVAYRTIEEKVLIYDFLLENKNQQMIKY